MTRNTPLELQPEETQSSCLSCLPWSRRRGASGGRERTERCLSPGSCDSSSRAGVGSRGESREEGRKKSWWGHDLEKAGVFSGDFNGIFGEVERGDEEGGMGSAQCSPSPSKTVVGRLRALEEGLRSLAVSHSHLKLDHQDKLEQLDAAIQQVARARGEGRCEPAVGRDVVEAVDDDTGEEGRRGKGEEDWRRQVTDLKAQLQNERDGTLAIITEAQKRLQALENKWYPSCVSPVCLSLCVCTCVHTRGPSYACSPTRPSNLTSRLTCASLCSPLTHALRAHHGVQDIGVSDGG